MSIKRLEACKFIKSQNHMVRNLLKISSLNTMSTLNIRNHNCLLSVRNQQLRANQIKMKVINRFMIFRIA